MKRGSNFMPILSQSSNDMAMAIPEDPEKHGTLMTSEEMRQQEKEFKETFLKFYPKLKMYIQDHIKQFHTLAEEADQVQKNRTVANWVAKFTKVPSFILAGVGLVLFLFSTGLSVAVSAISVALILLYVCITYVYREKEHKYISSTEAEAKKLESTAITLEVTIAMFRGTAMKIIKRTWNNGGACTGLEILIYLNRLVQDSKGLLEQAKSESGEMLKQWAQEVENMLVGLQQVYEVLK